MAGDEASEGCTHSEAASAEIWPLSRIVSVLQEEGNDIVDRMRAIFFARWHNCPESVSALSHGLSHKSVLLKHEIAYILGQMSQASALPILLSLCDNLEEAVMVRHEAGEALNALGITTPEVFACVERHIDDPDIVIRQTFRLTLEGLKRKKARRHPDAQESSREEPQEIVASAAVSNKTPLGKTTASTTETRLQTETSSGASTEPPDRFYIFSSPNNRQGVNRSSAPIRSPDSAALTTVEAYGHPDAKFANTKDPAEADPAVVSQRDVEGLARLLQEEEAELWDRYVAMFSLRDIASTAAVVALAESLGERSSALLRHEICFVLGQLQHPAATSALIDRLRDHDEATMVRHEAALSLGSVGSDIFSKEGRAIQPLIVQTLEEFSSDSDLCVAESAVVALKNIEWESGIVVS